MERCSIHKLFLLKVRWQNHWRQSTRQTASWNSLWFYKRHKCENQTFVSLISMYRSMPGWKKFWFAKICWNTIIWINAGLGLIVKLHSNQTRVATEKKQMVIFIRMVQKNRERGKFGTQLFSPYLVSFQSNITPLTRQTDMTDILSRMHATCILLYFSLDE